MTNNDNLNRPGLREIAPFNPQAAQTDAKHPEHSIDDVAIAADEIENMIFAVLTLLSENTNNSQEQRASITVLGAVQPHIAVIKKHCAQ